MQPIHAELWQMALAAVADSERAAEEYLKRAGWVPRVGVPTVGAFDSGWPNLGMRISTGADDPPDRAALFGPERGALKPLSFEDAPALAKFVKFVRQNEGLSGRLATLKIDGTPFTDFVEIEAASLPLSIMNRAAALGVRDPDHLLALYIQRERAWLLSRLPVEYLIPLALTSLDLDEPLILDDATRLEPLDRLTHAARATSWGGMSTVPDPVVSAATHAIVFSGHAIANPGPVARLLAPDVEAAPMRDADLVCQALRVLTHLPVGYAQVLRRPVGWADGWVHDLPPMTQTALLRRYPESFDDYGWLRTGRRVTREALGRLPDILAGLRTAAPRTTLAARRLSLAELRSDQDDRTVDACIGLEAMLGEGRDELTHRLALRAATALSTGQQPADATVVYQLVKDVYSRRSSVVHGTNTDKGRMIKLPSGPSIPAADVATMLLRALLQDQLARPGGWSPQSLDALLLSHLNAPATPNGREHES